MVVAILLLVSIIDILLFDLGRLTNYGYGYLAGKSLLFLLFAGAAWLSRKSLPKPIRSAHSVADKEIQEA